MLAHRETPEQAQYHPQYIGPHYLKLLRIKNFAGEEKNAFNKNLIHLIYILCMSGCLSVCLCPIKDVNICCESSKNPKNCLSMLRTCIQKFIYLKIKKKKKRKNY